VAFGDIVQSKTAVHASNTSVSITLDATPTEGNLLLACHFTGHANSEHASWSEAAALTDGGNSDQGAIYYHLAGAGESTTVTCTSASSDEHMLTVLEIEGPWNASPLDKSATAGPTDAGADSTTGTTATTSQNDEVAIALVTGRCASGGAGSSWGSWTNSFSEQSDIATTHKRCATATLVLTSTQAVETTATFTVSGQAKMGGVATFKKQGAGGVSIPVAMHHRQQQKMA
jgi:hypothetical protein